ncbi:MAG: hypothetical protein ACOC56_05030 [Atribacterota bacterium]
MKSQLCKRVVSLTISIIFLFPALSINIKLESVNIPLLSIIESYSEKLRKYIIYKNILYCTHYQLKNIREVSS